MQVSSAVQQAELGSAQDVQGGFGSSCDAEVTSTAPDSRSLEELALKKSPSPSAVISEVCWRKLGGFTWEKVCFFFPSKTLVM